MTAVHVRHHRDSTNARTIYSREKTYVVSLAAPQGTGKPKEIPGEPEEQVAKVAKAAGLLKGLIHISNQLTQLSWYYKTDLR